MRFTSGGEPVARVSWSPASPGGTARKSNGRHAGPDSPTTPGGDPLALIQDLYGDDVEETVRASAKRALTAAGYGSPVSARASLARASPAGRASASRLAHPGFASAARPRSASVAATSTSERPTRPTPLTTKETMGKLGELRYEARAATQRARRAERALRGKEQELEELKAKCASLARERSALSARLSARDPAHKNVAHKNPFGASGASHGSSAFAPRTTNAARGAHVATPKSPFSTTPRKPSGESLSLSSRWNQWEMEARRGDKRLAMLMRGYKEIEGELEAARASARVARESVAFSEDELEATRGALEELRGNFEAAKELLNEGLEARDALEQKVRSEAKKNGAIVPELESARVKCAELQAEAERSREKTNELLRRATARDRKIDALSKKLAAAAEAAAASEKAREKAEEEATRVDEQCRALRRRIATREAEAKVQKNAAGEDDARRAALEAELEAAREENAKLAAELDIKEEVQHARVDGLLDQGRVVEDAIRVRDDHTGRVRGRVSSEGGAVSDRRVSGETRRYVRAFIRVDITCTLFADCTFVAMHRDVCTLSRRAGAFRGARPVPHAPVLLSDLAELQPPVRLVVRERHQEPPRHLQRDDQVGVPLCAPPAGFIRRRTMG